MRGVPRSPGDLARPADQDLLAALLDPPATAIAARCARVGAEHDENPGGFTTGTTQSNDLPHGAECPWGVRESLEADTSGNRSLSANSRASPAARERTVSLSISLEARLHFPPENAVRSSSTGTTQSNAGSLTTARSHCGQRAASLSRRAPQNGYGSPRPRDEASISGRLAEGSRGVVASAGLSRVVPAMGVPSSGEAWRLRGRAGPWRERDVAAVGRSDANKHESTRTPHASSG